MTSSKVVTVSSLMLCQDKTLETVWKKNSLNIVLLCCNAVPFFDKMVVSCNDQLV